MNTPLGEEDLNTVAALLDEHGIYHDRLRIGPVQFNHCITDRKHVLVKITRPTMVSTRAQTEVTAARWALKHDIAATTPILDDAVAFTDSHGSTRYLTVWKWESFCTGPALLDQCRQTIDVIRHLNQTSPPPDATTLDPSYWRDALHARLAPHLDQADVQPLRDLSNLHTEQVITLWEGRPVSWVHGDLHLANLAWRVNGRPCTFDWESSATGPVEVDVAQLLRSIFVNPVGYAYTERVKAAKATIKAADRHLDLDWELVAALIKARAVSSMSLLLLTGNTGDYQANQAVLADPLTWLPR